MTLRKSKIIWLLVVIAVDAAVLWVALYGGFGLEVQAVIADFFGIAAR